MDMLQEPTHLKLTLAKFQYHLMRAMLLLRPSIYFIQTLKP